LEGCGDEAVIYKYSSILHLKDFKNKTYDINLNTINTVGRLKRDSPKQSANLRGCLKTVPFLLTFVWFNKNLIFT
jgi:hypothetical protein